jgi:hypothetical protein
VGAGICCMIVVYIVEWGNQGGPGMSQPEQRICGVTVKCGGRVDARHGAKPIPRVIGHAGRWKRAGMWLLVVM